MVQSRLGVLAEESRRLLRAAGVFGEVFWAGAVASLVGMAERPTEVRDKVQALVEQEFVVKRAASRFPSEDEYAFRHALLREGAYAMLTEEDRTLGHRLAGEWLEEHGEQDALLLAEHFDRGGDETRAGLYFLRVAEQAALGLDSAAAIARMKRALACRLPHELRLRCLGMLCELQFYKNEGVRDALPHAEELLRFAERDSAHWSQGMLIKLTASIQTGDLDTFLAMLGILAETRPEPEAVRPWFLGVATAISLLDILGRPRDADHLIEHLAEVAGAVGDRDPNASVLLSCILALRTAYAEEEPSKAMEHGKIASERSATMQHRRYLESAKLFNGVNYWHLGAFERAECILMESTLPDEEIGLAFSLRPFWPGLDARRAWRDG
jgi:hypothetical protein